MAAERAASSEGLSGAVGSTSMMAHSHMDDEIMLAISRRPWFLTTRISPQGCLPVLMTWQLASLRINDSRERQKPQCLL